MSDKSLNQRMLIILGVLALALFFLLRYDADQGVTHNLRPGLDIAGGVSMIFEIQSDEDDAQNPYLAEELKQLLMKRVDPQGVYSLTWRVLGTNRIEVQMPLPPKQNESLREAYFAAEQALVEGRVERSELEEALAAPAESRAGRLAELAGGSEARLKLLNDAAAAWDAYNAARALTSAQILAEEPENTDPEGRLRIRQRDALERLEDAKEAVYDMNLPMQRFMEVRDLEKDSERRKARLADLEGRYPELKPQLDSAIAAYDAWRGTRTFLEGPADLRRLIRGAGVLEFRILTEPSVENATRWDNYRKNLEEFGPAPRADDTEIWLKIDDPLAFFNRNSPSELAGLDPRAFETGGQGLVVGKRGDDWYVLASARPADGLLVEKGDSGKKWKVKSVGIGRDESGRRSVAFGLDSIGGSLFSRLTGDNIGRQLCIVVDNVAYSTATILSRIGDRGQIEGDFSTEKLSYLVQTMQAGVLPAKLKDTPLSERTIGSQFGVTNLQNAFRAGVVGLIIVAVIMIGYYNLSGAIAIVALLMNIMLTLSMMAMLGAQFTLAAIAGIILGIGMGVDQNVLIFERMREEKDRGATLRMIIKNGFDKAFSTIIDSNITTLLTCLIIYKIGSEEIKGFGLTLGWGIVISMFTGLFVTRTLFHLLMKLGILKGIGGLYLIKPPTIDWYGKRWFFVPLSFIVIFLGFALLFFRGAKDTLDVEFLGGISADVALKPEGSERWNDVTIGNRLSEVGAALKADGQKLATAAVEQLEPGLFRISAGDLSPARLTAFVMEPLESAGLTERGGLDDKSDPAAVKVRVREGVTREQVEQLVRGLATFGSDYSVLQAADDIGRSKIGQVLDTADGEVGRHWSITSTVTNKTLVTQALVQAFGDDLVIRPRVHYTFRGQNDKPFPITQRRLEDNVPGLPEGAGADVTDFLGGAALYFDELDPPQTVEDLQARVQSMRLAPDFASMPYRQARVIGVQPTGQQVDGRPTYRGVVLVVADDAVSYDENPTLWGAMANEELGLVAATLDTEQSLEKVTQFKPQVALQAQTQALLAIFLSWVMIIIYMWIRFGKPIYGFAGVVALVHDVAVAAAFIGISGWIGGVGNPIGYALLIDDFKIDMTVVAAVLTIIGFSINDTIVIFDRIRDLRGRLGIVTPKIINDAINQTLSRTILTALTVFVVVLVMYIFGGQSTRAFNFFMLIGVLSGTYSTVAIAAPLLMMRNTQEREVGKRLATA